MRAETSASISPFASMSSRVRSSSVSISTPAGASKGTRSLRPGCSTPPWIQWTSLASTPKSCCSMPRTHTDAVMVYSGTPTRRP